MCLKYMSQVGVFLGIFKQVGKWRDKIIMLIYPVVNTYFVIIIALMAWLAWVMLYIKVTLTQIGGNDGLSKRNSAGT